MKASSEWFFVDGCVYLVPRSPFTLSTSFDFVNHFDHFVDYFDHELPVRGYMGLIDVLFISVAGTIAGCDGPTGHCQLCENAAGLVPTFRPPKERCAIARHDWSRDLFD